MKRRTNEGKLVGEKDDKRLSRREFLKTSAFVGASAGLTIFSPKFGYGQKTGEPIKIGLIPPLTGVVSIYGESISQAAELTVQEINEAGGVLGREVKLLIQDEGSMPETAVPAAERLVKKEGCVMISGTLMSHSRLAVDNQVAEPLKVVMNNWSWDEGSICGRYFFSMAGLPNQQSGHSIPWMAKKFGKRFYFVGDNYEWPRGCITACKEALAKIPGEVVGEEYNPIGTSDFSSILMRIKKANPNVVVAYEAGTDFNAFSKQFTAMGLKDKMALLAGAYDEAMIPGLEPAVRKDIYTAQTYFMTVPTKENQTFLAKLRKKYGEKIFQTNFGEAAVHCIRIWAMAVKKAGTPHPDEVVKAQEGPPGQKYGLSSIGPQGKVTVVKANHYSRCSSYLAQGQADGTFKILESWHDQEPETLARYGGCVASVQSGCRPLKEKTCPKFPGE